MMIESLTPMPIILLLIDHSDCYINLAHWLSIICHGIIGSEIESLDIMFALFINGGISTPDSRLDFRAAYNLGAAKSAAIWVGRRVI